MLISKIEPHFKARRDRVLSHLNKEGAALLLMAPPEYLRNGDVHHDYRQDSHFFYLTGFEEPGSALLLLPDGRTVMFVRTKDPEREMWEGERYGVEGAVQIFGADAAYPSIELFQRLADFLKGCDQLYYRLGQHEFQDRQVLATLESMIRVPSRIGRGIVPVIDPSAFLGQSRHIKDAQEITALKKSCLLSAQAHNETLKFVRPKMNEFEVAALINYEFAKRGSQRLGYGSIVAGGKNAACLHYRSNNETLRDGDLLLIDAGAELDYYTADITRTFPVGREFTAHQAKLYDLVLSAELEAIAMVKPGVTLPAIHAKACEVLAQGMLSMGLLSGSLSEVIKNLAYNKFYPHKTSHWLGMDVHDVGPAQKRGDKGQYEPIPLEAGMVFTIEPGFYIQPWHTGLPKGFEPIGIRIEDDILVTSNGCEVLTQAAIKDREKILELRAY